MSCSNFETKTPNNTPRKFDHVSKDFKETSFQCNILAQTMATKPIVRHKNTYICFHNKDFVDSKYTQDLEDANGNYVNYCFLNDDNRLENRFLCWRCENQLQTACKKLLKIL